MLDEVLKSSSASNTGLASKTQSVKSKDWAKESITKLCLTRCHNEAPLVAHGVARLSAKLVKLRGFKRGE